MFVYIWWVDVLCDFLISYMFDMCKSVCLYMSWCFMWLFNFKKTKVDSWYIYDGLFFLTVWTDVIFLIVFRVGGKNSNKELILCLQVYWMLLGLRFYDWFFCRFAIVIFSRVSFIVREQFRCVWGQKGIPKSLN